VEGREAAWEKGGRRDGAATMGRRATDGGCRRHEVSDGPDGWVGGVGEREGGRREMGHRIKRVGGDGWAACGTLGAAGEKKEKGPF
jgi:hypothetical protein